ncbi:MAG: hypothetical protein V3T99_05795 [Nitrososphaerales archaeon]
MYILLSILLLVLPLSKVAFAQSTTPGRPGPLEEFVEEIKAAVEDAQREILEAFVEFCESRPDPGPGQGIFNCPILQLKGAQER